MMDRSRLDRVSDWEVLAHESGYCARLLASRCGVSLRHLERYFHEKFSRAPRVYLKKLALNRAQELLERGFTVKEVAAQVGYKATEHFSRDFKRVFGVCPSEWD